MTGFDPATEKAKLDPYCPVRNVTTDYPPTMLVHGTEDTDVPYELSADMAKEFDPAQGAARTGDGEGRRPRPRAAATRSSSPRRTRRRSRSSGSD